MKIIDCYGHESTDTERYRKREEKPYMTDTATDNVVYMRYGKGDNCPIVRVLTASNVVTQSWTYGAWASRANLTYDKMLSEAIAIED